MKKFPILALAACIVAPSLPALAVERTLVADLADYSLEQLAGVRVTTVSRREERLVDAPASIFVMTAEDIRRSGATSLGQVLRLAPNLMVVRGDQNQFIASARGGLAGTANKMLVLVDGRTVYSPLFSGVFWDAQDVVLEDIDRIEVISGPGSTLWGTNAVNGVINIITKTARETQGGLGVAYAGGDERGVVARTGSALGGGGAWRAYGKYAKRDDLALASGASAHDASERWQAGFRSDWGAGRAQSTFQGDVYQAHVDYLGGPRDLSGGNLLARWRTTYASGSQLMVQAYYDRTEREHQGSFRETRDTYDLEALHTLARRRGHELAWGGGLRSSRDRTQKTPVLAFLPASRDLRVATLFGQDEIALAPALHLTAGVRAEHNSYTGLEWLPNLRLAWEAAPSHLVWAALTRTVRSPSRIDRDLVVPGMPPYVLVSNDSFRSEKANVAELGYRARFAADATLSLTAFHHEFRDLRTVEPGAAGLVVANGADGRLSGLEAWGDWMVRPGWRLVGGFTVMTQETSLDPGHTNLSDPPLGNNPRRTAMLRSLWNVTPEHELDLAWRYQGRLETPEVPAYGVLDARLGWRPSAQLDVSLLVANVFDREHREFATASQGAVFGRSVLLKVTWSP